MKYSVIHHGATRKTGSSWRTVINGASTLTLDHNLGDVRKRLARGSVAEDVRRVGEDFKAAIRSIRGELDAA